jgi:LysM repeat protein
VGPSVPLSAIGKASNASVSAMQDLNPQILRGMTPPKDSTFIRIPTGAADSFAVAFDALPKSDRTAFTSVESKKGQSFGSIAAKNDIAARQLAVYNPTLRTLKSGNLAPGQMVLVPSEAVVAAATAAPDPAIERYGSSSKSLTTHVVKSGETLTSVAKKYHTTTAAIMKANGMKRALVFPGQSIVVKNTASSKRAMLASSNGKSSSKSASSTSAKSSETHVASAGASKTKGAKSSAKTTVAKGASKSTSKATTVAKSATKNSTAIPVATAARLKKPTVEKVSEKKDTKGKKKRQS